MADKKRFKGVAPVNEQARRYHYDLETVTEHGQVVGRVYRRRPLFETMFARGEISREEAQALRYYRERYELSNFSLTRSCLLQRYGRSLNGGSSPLVLRAASEVQAMEAAAGLFLMAFRKVVIEDMSFNRIAMDRYGSVQKDIGGQQRIVPKSKQHTRRIKSEFLTALKCFLPVAQSFFVSNFSVDYPTHTRHKRSISGITPKLKDARNAARA
jgi:hypothetical protein